MGLFSPYKRQRVKLETLKRYYTQTLRRIKKENRATLYDGEAYIGLPQEILDLHILIDARIRVHYRNSHYQDSYYYITAIRAELISLIEEMIQKINTRMALIRSARMLWKISLVMIGLYALLHIIYILMISGE